MQVILNNSIYFKQKYGGVSRYSSCLTNQLNKDKNINLKIIAPLYKNRFLFKNKNNLKIYGVYFPRYPNFKFLNFLNDNLTNFLKKKINGKIIHDFYYPNILSSNSKKKILTIHDTIHERFENLYKSDYINHRKKLIKHYDFFLCVSNNTKNDFIDFYKISEDRVFVISHGYDHLNETEAKDLSNIKFLQKPFILYVGGRHKYKNFKLLIKAFSKSKFLMNEFNIICYGGERLSNEEINLLNELNVNKKVYHIFGDDTYLKGLYLKANLLVSTSNYEGFGLNVLEAVSLNCPVLANENIVFKEIFGNLIFYFKNNVDDLISKLEKILREDKFFHESNALKEYLKKYTWINTAEKTKKIYEIL